MLQYLARLFRQPLMSSLGLLDKLRMLALSISNLTQTRIYTEEYLKFDSQYFDLLHQHKSGTLKARSETLLVPVLFNGKNLNAQMQSIFTKKKKK